MTKEKDDRYAGMNNWSFMEQLATRNRSIADIIHIVDNRSAYFETIWPFGDERKYGGIYKMDNIEIEAPDFCKERGMTIDRMLIEIHRENARAMAYCLSGGGCWAEWQLYEAIKFEKVFAAYLYKNAHKKISGVITDENRPLWEYEKLSYKEIAAIWHIAMQMWENMC